MTQQISRDRRADVARPAGHDRNVPIQIQNPYPPRRQRAAVKHRKSHGTGQDCTFWRTHASKELDPTDPAPTPASRTGSTSGDRHLKTFVPSFKPCPRPGKTHLNIVKSTTTSGR
jgi:hypothetical protein